MKKCYIDANILVYAVDVSSEFHKKTAQLLQDLKRENYTFYLTPLVLDELICVLKYMLSKKNHGQNKEKTWKELKETINVLLHTPHVEIVHPTAPKYDHIVVVDYMKNYKLRPRDAYHLLAMKTNNISHIATHDSDFLKAKIPSINLVTINNK